LQDLLFGYCLFFYTGLQMNKVKTKKQQVSG